jgi:hypothetical protein
VRPRSFFLEPLAPALPLVVPGLGLGFGLGFASSDIAVEDGSEDLVRVRRICSVLAAHEDCLPFCIYEGGSPQTSPPQTSINTQSVRSCLLFPFLVQYRENSPVSSPPSRTSPAPPSVTKVLLQTPQACQTLKDLCTHRDRSTSTPLISLEDADQLRVFLFSPFLRESGAMIVISLDAAREKLIGVLPQILNETFRLLPPPAAESAVAVASAAAVVSAAAVAWEVFSGVS